MANPNDNLSRNVRVGAFLVAGLGVLFALVFVLGSRQSMFSRKVTLHTSFQNISGLAVGTSVRLAGVDIGLVEDITFDPDPGIKAVHVELSIERQYLARVRADSVASLGSKGLLGDMLVNISLGSPTAAHLKPGGMIPSKEVVGLGEVLSTVQETLGNVKNLSGDLGEVIKRVLNKDVSNDIGRIVHSFAALAEQAEKGQGLVHAVLYDKKLADDAKGMVAGARETVGTADRALARVNHVLATTDLQKTLVNIGSAAKEAADVIGQVKHGNGLAHTLIYEKDTTRLVANITELSSALRTVGDDLTHGRGTIGALLKDPTIYSDLKIILGNVKRSRMIRSLVRFTVAADDLEAPPPPAVGKNDKD